MDGNMAAAHIAYAFSEMPNLDSFTLTDEITIGLRGGMSNAFTKSGLKSLTVDVETVPNRFAFYANELAKITGFPVFHNHLTRDIVHELYPHTLGEHYDLVHDLRLTVFFIGNFLPWSSALNTHPLPVRVWHRSFRSRHRASA